MEEEYGVQLQDCSREGAIKRALAYRWIVWGVMTFAFMIVFFHRLAAAVVREDVTAAFSLNAADFGKMSSMYFYAYMAMQIPVGLLADSLGARLTVSAGMFVAGAGSIMFGLAPSYGWLLAGRFLVGLGVATVFVCIMKIQSQWFRDGEFATISGATSFIGNAGGILSQGPLALLLTLVTWRSSFVAIGAATLGVALICLLLIRNRPQDIGSPPLNEREMLRHGKPPEPFSVMEGIRAVLSVRGVRMAALFYFFNQAGFFSLVGTWGIPWLVHVYGMTVAEASSLTVMMVLGTMTGGLFNGWFSDRIGRRRPPMIVASFFQTLLWGCVVMPWESRLGPGVLRLLFLALGFTNACFVLSWSVAKEQSSERYTGLAISVLNTAGFLAIAIVTSFMGVLIDLYSSTSAETAYRMAFSIGLACTFVSLVVAFFIPELGEKHGRQEGLS
ncbi:MAG: MFS transporter [Synergistota bacterium]|jgi:sugar phosphate permease|nr:MFS transporter [Synergistota bacterium]OPZ40915.1 MAG: putative sulfoacetate transporter SauU [Synergistetes bacterium ADurb.BinA166]